MSGDEALLAKLGYKQELRREFSPIEVFGIGFSIIGLIPSIGWVSNNVNVLQTYSFKPALFFIFLSLMAA